MKGLPVTPIEVISSSASAASIAAFSDSSERGPKVFGFVWSSPLSRVIRPMNAGGAAPAGGQGDLAEQRPRDPLGVGGDLLGAGEQGGQVRAWVW